MCGPIRSWITPRIHMEAGDANFTQVVFRNPEGESALVQTKPGISAQHNRASPK